MCNSVQVRGKTVYLQYSNRQEIINAKNTADTPSNVLLVSLENLMVSSLITCNDWRTSSLSFWPTLHCLHEGTLLENRSQYTQFCVKQSV